jgi:glucan 1,3-beta-glucosidase
MRFSTTLAAAAVAASGPSLVAAAGTLGFALGAKLGDGSCKYRADYEADFKAIAAESGSKIVRIYAADQCNTAQQILPAAKAQGFKVVLGIWYGFLLPLSVDSLLRCIQDTCAGMF